MIIRVPFPFLASCASDMAQVFISWKGGGFAIAVLPDFSPFAWWHDNALPTATPAPLSRLRLTSMCSDEPANVRVWRVRDPNPVDVLVTWQVVGTSQTNSLTVPASSDAFFQTVTVSGPNTTRILVNNIQQDVKASGGAQCSP